MGRKMLGQVDKQGSPPNRQSKGQPYVWKDRRTVSEHTAGHMDMDIWTDAGRRAEQTDALGTFVSAGHPLQGCDIVVMLPYREREHSYLSGQ